METFKTILRIVFGTVDVLIALTVIVYLTSGPWASIAIYIYIYWLNFINVPLAIAFIFVLLYQCLFRKKPFSFFKTEIFYLLIQICAGVFIPLLCQNC
jgi:hypothetical protein